MESAIRLSSAPFVAASQRRGQCVVSRGEGRRRAGAGGPGGSGPGGLLASACSSRKGLPTGLPARICAAASPATRCEQVWQSGVGGRASGAPVRQKGLHSIDTNDWKL